MSVSIIGISVLFAVASGFVLWTLGQEFVSAFMPERDKGPRAAASGNLRALTDAQRERKKVFALKGGPSIPEPKDGDNLALVAAAETDLGRKRAEAKRGIRSCTTSSR